MPKQVRIAPPMNHSEMMSEVQPSMVELVTCLYRPYMMSTVDTTSMASPKKVMKRSGLSENDVMPTKAKLSILVSGYFELPAMRSLRV